LRLFVISWVLALTLVIAANFAHSQLLALIAIAALGMALVMTRVLRFSRPKDRPSR
jgi:hypothetical protein